MYNMPTSGVHVSLHYIAVHSKQNNNAIPKRPRLKSLCRTEHRI